MSDYQRERGKLRLINPYEGEDFLALCKRITLESGFKGDYYEGCLFDEYYNKYLNIDNNLYEIYDYERLEIENDYAHVNKQPDGTYTFEVQYYNGGCGMGEMIESGFNKLDKDE